MSTPSLVLIPTIVGLLAALIVNVTCTRGMAELQAETNSRLNARDVYADRLRAKYASATERADATERELADVRHALEQCEIDRNALAKERDDARRLARDGRAEASRESGRLSHEVRLAERARSAAVAQARLWREKYDVQQWLHDTQAADAETYLALAESYAADAERLRAALSMTAVFALGAADGRS